MKQKILSLISCALIACNIFTTMSYAEESVEPPMEIVEPAAEESEEIEEIEISDSESNETVSEEKIESKEVEVEDADVAVGEEEQTLSEEANTNPLEAESENDNETFKVSFIDSIDNSEFAAYTVNEGDSVEELPEAPTHDGYDFVEYVGNYIDVVSDEEVIAKYDKVEESNELVYKELSSEVAGYTIIITGNMPEDTELLAEKIGNSTAEKTVEDKLDITFAAQVSFDIKLMSGEKQYQPTEFGEEVSVTIKGLDTAEELEVYRITDDGTVSDMSASQNGESLEFDTDHFTTYTVGTTEYKSLSKGTYLGLSYEYFDEDNDNQPDLVVVTGEQTIPAFVRFDSPEEEKAYRDKYVKDAVYVSTEGSKNLGFTDQNDTTAMPPWFSHITPVKKVHFKDVKLLNAYDLFGNCFSIEEIIFENVDTSQCVDMGRMFYFCENLTTLKITNPLDTSNVCKMDEMFAGCKKLKTLDGENNFNGQSGLFTDTSNVKAFDWMFYQCYELESIDLSCIDSSSAETMIAMFLVSPYHQSKIKTIKLPADLKLAKDVSKMFANSVLLEGGFSTTNWDTSRVTTMDQMFFNCFKLSELDVSNWNTSSVTNIEHAFDRCESLQILDISNWDVAKVTNMKDALSFLRNVEELDVSKWNTSSCTDMGELFYGNIKVKKLDVSGWDVSKVKNMYMMFNGCSKLEYLDLSTWDVSKVEDFGSGATYRIFQDCDNLTVIDMFRTDVIKEEVGIPEIPSAQTTSNLMLGNSFMYIDDNKDGKADSAYKKFKVFKKDSVSHRYIFDDNPVAEKNTLENFKKNYTIINLVEPSDDAEAFEYLDPEYGKVVFHNRYLVKDFEIIKEECLDESDPLNKTGRAFVYTIKMDGDVLKVIAGEHCKRSGPDGTYGTDDDYSSWDIEPSNHIMYQPLNPISQLKKDEYYEEFKDFVIYSTGEKITLSRNEWDFNVDEGNEMAYEAYTFRLATFKLVLKDEKGKVLYSDHVTYGEPLADILKVYGKKWINADGDEYTPGTMPIRGMTLTRVHTHTPAASKTENNVKPTHTKDGHYDSVVYCEECGAELSRETITVAATSHVPGTPVEENRVDATCTEPGHYESVVYCVDDGDELSRETITLDPLGHIAGAEVRENVVDATEEEEGSYESVVYCKHCHVELSRETKSIPKIEKNKPQDIVNPSGNENPNPGQEPTKPGAGDDNKPSDLIIDIVIDEEEETPINPGHELIVSLPNSKPDDNLIDDGLELKTVDIVAMSDDSQLKKVDLADDKADDTAKESSFVEKVIKAVVVTVSAAGTTGGIFFVIIWFRRRKVRGKLISKDGINYSNCVVTLEGRDKLRTRTNKNGEFIFRNLKKDTYILTVFNESDEILFSCELLTSSKDRKNEENVTVLENNVLAYQYSVAGQTYILDIFA
ncbi:BspA family leucine-rich repeat surface protein [Pseudobutyrivibrio ruminis]|uniref:Surface protein n=1 Tax=Pseudobutyrivibrio ruminis DSM 9787 TaxID=1123011 RepID=A0A285T9F9_9FIRM|nr:BspA family leucine-rich repeat surface protein [Pseudobutyrivibrio ruminis]SOC16333.1 surface protein [Pseudobutyrivibrio ruminis DSM 9787]